MSSADAPADPGSTAARGRAYEDLALATLLAAGYELVDRNVVCGGVELDLVVRDPHGGPHVFVEVRARSSDDRGHPLETIGPAKRRRIVRGAGAWLVSQGLWERVEVRFDVVTIVDGEGGPVVAHLEDAFWA